MTLNQSSRSSMRSRSSKKWKFQEIGWKVWIIENFIFIISFSKFPYKFDICIGLSHFVVAEHWSRCAMYFHASRNFLSQTWETNTCSSHSLGGNQVVLLIHFIYSLCWAFNIAGSYKQTLVYMYLFSTKKNEHMLQYMEIHT